MNRRQNHIGYTRQVMEINREVGEQKQSLYRFINGLHLFTFHPQAKEETTFLYREIFEERIYFRHGITLAPGDTVVDIGANIGMFAVYSELLFPEPSALHILCVEPCLAAYNLLQKNLKRYAPQAIAVQGAVGVIPEDKIAINCDKKENDNDKTCRMLFLPQYPGNSCLSKLRSENATRRRRFINPAILFNSNKKVDRGIIEEEEEEEEEEEVVIEEECPVISMSTVMRMAKSLQSFDLNHIFIHEHEKKKRKSEIQNSRISLMKIDVEGSELAALQSKICFSFSFVFL
jgi:hypothetical protein